MTTNKAPSRGQGRALVRVRDLPVNSKGISLHCDVCSASYSATRGDYFWAPVARILVCCRQPMRLVRKVVRYETVTSNASKAGG